MAVAAVGNQYRIKGQPAGLACLLGDHGGAIRHGVHGTDRAAHPSLVWQCLQVLVQ